MALRAVAFTSPHSFEQAGEDDVRGVKAGTVEGHDMGPGDGPRQVLCKEAPGRERTGVEWDDDRVDRELACQWQGEEGPCAP